MCLSMGAFWACTNNFVHMWFYTWYTLLLHWRSVSGQWSMSCHSLLPLSERNHEPWCVSLDATICGILDLVYPHGRHYRLLFRSWNRILYIIPHDQLVFFDHSLLPFLLGYFFIAGRICINDVTQQCHVARLYMSLLLLLEVLSYFSSSWIISHSQDGIHLSRWI